MAPRDEPAIPEAIPHDVGDGALRCLQDLENRVRWLSSWTIHHANHIREHVDGLKVGGHQAS